MHTKSALKVKIFISVIGSMFLILIARIYFLQIIKGEDYLQRSESNFIQERMIKHYRGQIIDNEGALLADNRLAYDIYVTFAMLPDRIKNIKTLFSSLKLNRKELQKIEHKIINIDASNFLKKNHEIILAKENLSIKQCQIIAENARINMFQGVKIINKGLVCNVLIDVYMFPSKAKTIYDLSKLINIETKYLLDLWQKVEHKSLGLARFKPHLLMADVGFDAYARIENAIALGKLSGVTTVTSMRRRYLSKHLTTHAVGILNQVSLSDIKDNPFTYRSGDFIGRNGVEASFENILRGKDGIEHVVVDAKGRRFDDSKEENLLGEDRIIEPIAGHNVRLSLDSDLQKVAFEYFKGDAGSVLVYDVNTGFILAMSSFPSFDPNLLVSAENHNFFKKLVADKLRPLRNKAIQDHYSPGSTFKPITAMAGLKNNLITPTTSHHCSGVFHIHKTMWRCFKREGHGTLSLVEALKVSCDSYFYELGQRLGLDTLSQTALMLGFGQKPDIGFSGETAGILPSKDYYKKRLGYVAPGFVVNTAIGQGDLSASPLQLAMAYAAIANGGKVYKPQIVKEIFTNTGQTIKKFDPDIKTNLSDSALGFKEILHGLSFVTEQGGSAHSIRYKPEHSDLAKWLKEENIAIVGKTGTAQVVKLSKQIKHIDPALLPYEHRDHAWFIAIYPKENPQIVVVVMTEHALGTGGAISAPVALRIIKKWHEKNQSLLAQGE